MAYGYCFVCKTRVSTSDIDSGHGRRFPQGLCCRSCVQGVEEAVALANPSPSDTQVPEAESLR